MKTKLETARELAEAHFRVEPDLKRVFLLDPVAENDPREPIKLLEVVEGTIETDFDAVAFAPNPTRGVPYPSLIVEISPRQYAALSDGNVQVDKQVWRVGRELHAA